MSLLNIEVVYACQDNYRCLAVQVAQGATIQQAIEQSGIIALYPEIDLNINQVGVYNQIKSLDTIVEAGDRVEVYRPLRLSAMAARAVRATLQQVKQRSRAKDRK